MERKKLSIFQWTTIIITAILIIANIVLIGIIIDLKLKTENLKNKNDEISDNFTPPKYNNTQYVYLKEIYKTSM